MKNPDRSPNKRGQQATLNKGASRYTVNRSGGPDANAKPKHGGTGMNKKSGGGYNVNRQGGGYQGRGTSEKAGNMPPNRDPRD